MDRNGMQNCDSSATFVNPNATQPLGSLTSYGYFLYRNGRVDNSTTLVNLIILIDATYLKTR